jgi:hypothetical protein
MIIKRWDGSAFVEEHPKTKAQLIYNDANNATIFDGDDKIKPAYLPNSVFDSLFFFSTIANGFDIREIGVLAVQNAASLGRSAVGYYWVATANNTASTGSVSSAQFGSPLVYAAGGGFSRSEEGVVSGQGVTLETSDWIILTSITGNGTVETPYVFNYSVVNNTYENASTTVDGIVRLSSQTVYANLTGNNVITDAKLKALVDNAAFAAGNHTHGNITNDGKITTDTAAGSGQHLVVTSTGDVVQQSAITLGTTTTTYLRNDGAWGTPVGTTYGKATTTALGLVEVAFADLATAPTITASTTADRYYGVQLNSAQQMVVNVPWSDTNTTYSAATATTLGLVELFSNTDNPTAANAVTDTAGRTYGLQLNSANQGVINVPWTDTVYSLPIATNAALGGVKLGVAAAAATVQGASTTAGRFYPVGAATDGTMYVNVPWADTNTTYSVATNSVLGLVELFDNTDQSVAANTVSSTAGRTYGLQLNSANQGVINVPWTDTVATATALGGLTATSNSFQMAHPFFVQADAPATPLAGTIWFDL